MNLDTITPVILTLNEQDNIERALLALSWASRIVVVDSFSTDRTLEICAGFESVEVFQRDFDDHASQWNFGLSQVHSDWILSLDADYIVGEDLVSEMSGLDPRSEQTGYAIPFEYHISGKRLVSSILPPRTALFRRSHAKYVLDGHTQLLKLEGASGELRSPLIHDDRKPFSRWYWSQVRYARLECDKIASSDWSTLSSVDRLRKAILPATLMIVPYCLFMKGGIVDGWRGFYYAGQRFIAEALLSYFLIQRIFFGSQHEQVHRPR